MFDSAHALIPAAAAAAGGACVGTRTRSGQDRRREGGRYRSPRSAGRSDAGPARLPDLTVNATGADADSRLELLRRETH